MAVTFLTNEDKNVLDQQIETLSDRIDDIKSGNGASDVVVDNTLTVGGAAADAKVTGNMLKSLNEEIDMLKGGIENEGGPVNIEFDVENGYMNSSGQYISNDIKTIHTSKIETSNVEQIEIGAYPEGNMHICFFDENEQYIKRTYVGQNSVITKTSHAEMETAAFFWIQWSRGKEVSEDEFRSFVTVISVMTIDRVSVLENSVFKSEKNLILRKDFYVMPTWSGMVDWINDFPEDEMTNDFVNNSTFTEWYNRYHALLAEYTDIGLEEIDMSTQYLADNPDESIPTYITDIENGGLYLYHLPPLNSNGHSSQFTGKHTKVLLVSALHGMEKASIYYNYKLLRDLCEDTGDNRDITIMRNFCDIYILPLASPYGVQNNSRYNGNGINLNRDFAVSNWIPREGETGYPENPNSQFETRLISYWIKKLKPQVVNDIHVSSGNEQTETGKFINWGGSQIPQINLLLEQHIRDVTPYVKKHFSPNFDRFKSIVFGHCESVNVDTRKSGKLPNYACQQGAISATFEVVKRLIWNAGTTDSPNYITIFTNEDNQAQLCEMNYFTYRHWLIELITTAADILNHTDRWDEYVELFNSNINFDTI